MSASLDLVPARVVVAGAVFKRARVVIADDRGRVFNENRMGAVELVAEGTVASSTRHGSRVEVVLDDGSRWEATKISTCSCHTRELRNVKPWADSWAVA